MVKAVIINNRSNACIFLDNANFDKLLSQVLPHFGIEHRLWQFESKFHLASFFVMAFELIIIDRLYWVRGSAYTLESGGYLWHGWRCPHM
jgi:hypothetical protein